MERSDTCSWLFWSLCFLLSWCLQFTQLLEQFKLLLIVIACVWTPFPSGTVMAWRPEHHASVHPLNQTCLQFPTIWVPRHSPSVPESCCQLPPGHKQPPEGITPQPPVGLPNKIFSALPAIWSTTAAPSSPGAALSVQPHRIYFN